MLETDSLESAGKAFFGLNRLFKSLNGMRGEGGRNSSRPQEEQEEKLKQRPHREVHNSVSQMISCNRQQPREVPDDSFKVRLEEQGRDSRWGKNVLDLSLALRQTSIRSYKAVCCAAELQDKCWHTWRCSSVKTCFRRSGLDLNAFLEDSRSPVPTFAGTRCIPQAMNWKETKHY